MDNQQWIELLLFSKDAPAVIWQHIADHLLEIALQNGKYALLHQATVFPDRLLSEAAYTLWSDFSASAPHTSACLTGIPHSHAILILDALSLRELPIIMQEAEQRNITAKAALTFSEVPSDTDAFAQALGLPGRANLENNGKSKNFKVFAGEECYTDSVRIPFADVHVDSMPNIFIWHSFLDDHIHNGCTGTELENHAKTALTSDGFWSFVDKMRQGRKLVITSDHGYGVAEQFSSELKDEAARMMKDHFKAQRFASSSEPVSKFIPPLFIQHGSLRVVTGQRKWKVQGSSKVTHSGLSLLEVASPWIEINGR